MVFKRFLYYWRFPLLFFILFFVLLWFGSFVSEPAASILSVIWLFIDIPCFVIFTIRAIYLRICSIVKYFQTGERMEDFTFFEVDFVENLIFNISYTIDMLKSLSPSLRKRFILFRFFAVVLIIVGCIGALIFAFLPPIIVIFTLVIIAGATLWIMADHNSYNSKVKGVRMIPCPEDMTLDQLYESLYDIPTSLGHPYFAEVMGFYAPIIVYGSKEDDYIYVVYRPDFKDFLYVSNLSSFSLKEPPAEVPAADEYDKHASKNDIQDKEVPADDGRVKNVVQEFEFYLDEITAAVEAAVEGLE